MGEGIHEDHAFDMNLHFVFNAYNPDNEKAGKEDEVGVEVEVGEEDIYCADWSHSGDYLDDDYLRADTALVGFLN